MRRIETGLPGVCLLEPEVHRDRRGRVYESWNARHFARLGLDATFVQETHSVSSRGVLRGLHYQLRAPQGKLIRVVRGQIFDVAVDLRRSSPHFGRWTGQRLSENSPSLLWVPPGFAHGFLVESQEAEVVYLMTAFHDPADGHGLRWDDPALGIAWPQDGLPPLLAERDCHWPPLDAAPVYP